MTLASSEAKKESRETNFTHAKGGIPHPHGIFTFHLIEGLYGKASDDDPTGIITLSGLWKYVEDQIEGMGKQKPKFFAADASRMSAIKIAVSHQKFNEYITNRLEKADDYCRKIKSDPAFIFLAINEINTVLNTDPKNAEALDRKKKICEKIDQLWKQGRIWISSNKIDVLRYIPNVCPTLQDLVDASPNFDKLIRLDNIMEYLIGSLFEVSIGQIDFNVFIERCEVHNNSPSTKQQIISKIVGMEGGSL